MKILKQGFVLFLITPTLAAGFFISLPTSAAVTHIVINEIQIAGATTTDEFIELFNPTGETVTLTGWRLSKRTASGNQYNLLTTFPEIILAPGQYYLIAHPNGYTGITIPDAIYSTQESLAANNTVVLFSDAGDTIVDLVGYGTASSFEEAAALNPEATQSIARITNGEDTDNNAADFTIAVSPTPMNLTSATPSSNPPPSPPQTPETPEDETENPPAEPQPTPSGSNTPLPSMRGDVVINEFVADPADGEEEWIELINRSGKTIDLTDWKIEDGGEHSTKLSGTISQTSPNNFFLVKNPTGNLNNAGDRIVLRSPEGVVIDDLSYGNWDDGNLNDNAPTAADPSSIARIVDGGISGNPAHDFTQTLTPTLGQPNIITATTSTINTGPLTLRLSELYPNPAGSDDAEFIELTNIGTVEVDARGWQIIDASGATYIIDAKDFTKVLISPGAFFILPRAVTKIALNNSGTETIRLFPPASTTPIHEISYSGSAPEGASSANFNEKWQWTTTVTPGSANILTTINREPKAAIECDKNGTAGVAIRMSAEDSTDADGNNLTIKWNFGDKTTGEGEIVEHTYMSAGQYIVSISVDDGHGGVATDKTTINITAAKTPARAVLGVALSNPLANIRLSEIFPAPPKGEEEWLEIENDDDATAYLTGWAIQDASGRSFTFADDVTILPHEFLLVPKSLSHISLNNTGDDISLISPNGEIIEEITYPSAKVSMSWVVDEYGEWGWSRVATPQKPNQIELPAGEATANDASSPITRASQSISVTGIITSTPGMVGERVIYLSQITGIEGLSNLRLDLPTGKLPEMKIGERLQAVGTKRTVSGEIRLKVGDIALLAILDTQSVEIKSEELNLDDIDNQLGGLVQASGMVERKYNGGFILAMEDGETIRVALPWGGSRSFPYPVGTKVAVEGVLSKTSAGPRILLRQLPDLTVASEPITETPMPSNPSSSFSIIPYLIVTGLGIIVLAGVFIYRRRKPSSDFLLEEEEELV